MVLKDKLLSPEDDSLPMRDSHPYVHYKLKALEFYFSVTNTAMYKKWPNRWYIDLQAGPGKNRIGNTVALGSPLLALAAPHPSTRFIFNEMDPKLYDALCQRVSASQLAGQVTVFCDDANSVVTQVCREIPRSSLNIAFLDPQGLELHWSTVEQLARMKTMDMIITFPTGPLPRVIQSGNDEAVTRFFGTSDWRSNCEKAGRIHRRALIDFYRKNLEKFDYHIVIDPELGGHDIVVRNSKNAEVYSLIFASKHPLGDEFWRKAAKSVQPPRLPGLE